MFCILFCFFKKSEKLFSQQFIVHKSEANIKRSKRTLFQPQKPHSQRHTSNTSSHQRQLSPADQLAMKQEIDQIEKEFVFQYINVLCFFKKVVRLYRYNNAIDEIILALYWRELEQVCYGYDIMLQKLQEHLDEREAMACSTTVIK